MSKKVLIMAGGTGGHIFPALAIAKELKARGVTIEWLGGRNGLEKSLVPKHGYKLYSVYTSGLRGKNVITILKAFFFLGLGLLQTILVFIKFRPNKVIGMGGYVSGIGGLLAKLLFIPLIIHEQNTIPGTTNRLLSKLANKSFQAFENTFDKKIKASTVGNPLLFRPISKKTPKLVQKILILGGSLGAQKINETITKINTPLSIWHQTGAKHFDNVKASYNTDLHLDLKIEPFIEDMANAYAWADIVICRAGAMTISELIASKTIAILIPFPYAVDDHQTINAQYLSKNGAGILIKEDDLSADLIDMELSRLSPEKLQEITTKLELLSVLSPEIIIADYLFD